MNKFELYFISIKNEAVKQSCIALVNKSNTCDQEKGGIVAATWIKSHKAESLHQNSSVLVPETLCCRFFFITSSVLFAEVPVIESITYINYYKITLIVTKPLLYQ